MDFLSSMFDPKNFAGITGLLDRLGRGASLPIPQQPAAFGLAGPAAPAMLPQPADQSSPLDSAQWPYGPTGAPSDANARLPANAAPTSGIAPMGLAPPSMDGPMNFLGGVQDKINDNSNMLLGLAAGIAGGRNWGDGISKGMSLAMQGGQLDTRQGNSNRTQQFLLSKGMDPETARTVASNPTLLRSVLPQLFGAADRTNDIKEYEYALKQGFKGSLTEWQAQKKSDPNAIKVLGQGGELYKTGPDGNPVIIHKNETETAMLDEATTSAMAAQYLAGDRTVMQNLGRGTQGAANVVKLRNEIYKQAQGAGLNGRDIVDNFNEQAGALAGQRAVGTRAANISLAANEANNMIPIALAASEKLPRSQYMPWNQMVQAVQKGSSSPELASFVAATNSLVNSYVRAVSPSGVPTDSMREHAYSMLNAAQGPKAYEAVIETMKQEMKAALEAPSQVKKELRHKENDAPRMGRTPLGVSWSLE